MHSVSRIPYAKDIPLVIKLSVSQGELTEKAAELISRLEEMPLQAEDGGKR